MPSTGEYPLRLVDFDVAEVTAASAAQQDPAPDQLRTLLENLLGELKANRRRHARVVVRTGGKVVFLRAEDIGWVEAAGNYVRLHVGGESHVLRESMKNMEARLDPEVVRPHPSVGDRERQSDSRAAAVVPRRVRRDPPGRHAPHGEPGVQRPAGPAHRLISDRSASSNRGCRNSNPAPASRFGTTR